MDIKLAKKVIKYVEKNPSRWDQDSFLYIPETPDTSSVDILSKSRKEIVTCGTTACIAGWALILSKKDKRQEIVNRCNDWTSAGAAALDIPYATAADIFNSMNPNVALSMLKDLIDANS